MPDACNFGFIIFITKIHLFFFSQISHEFDDVEDSIASMIMTMNNDLNMMKTSYNTID